MSLYNTLLERLDGRQYNGYFAACCVFHDDRKPSMFVYEDGFHCKSCGVKGTLQKLNRKIGTHFSPVTQRQVSEVLPKWRAWGDTLEEIADTCHNSLRKFAQFQKYFRKRKIEEFIEKGKFGFRDNWAVLPVMDIQLRVVDIVVRSISERTRTPRYVIIGNTLSDHNHLYSPDWKRVQKSELVYVVFGMMDAWSLEALELPCVTGITGKGINPDLLQQLNKRMVILPDEGEEKDAHKLANRLGWKYKVKELQYPEMCKDIDDVRVQYGNDVLRNLL